MLVPVVISFVNMALNFREIFRTYLRQTYKRDRRKGVWKSSKCLLTREAFSMKKKLKIRKQFVKLCGGCKKAL